MYKRINTVFILITLAFLMASCGTDKEAVTKLAKAEAGITYRQYSDVNVSASAGIATGELTAVNLEGMREVMTELVRNATIYSKPSLNASVVGYMDSGSDIIIYGLTEDEDWVIVNYNGRIGFITPDMVDLEEEDVPTQRPSTNSGQNSNQGGGASSGQASNPSTGGGATNNPGSEPNEPSSEPNEPSSEPDEPSSEPDEPSSEPDEPSSEPEEPSSEPEEPSSEPEEPSSEPEDEFFNPNIGEIEGPL